MYTILSKLQTARTVCGIANREALLSHDLLVNNAQQQSLLFLFMFLQRGSIKGACWPHLVKIVGSLPNDAVHAWVGPHGEVGLHHHTAVLAGLALQGAGVRHRLHPVKTSRLPPAALIHS